MNKSKEFIKIKKSTRNTLLFLIALLFLVSWLRLVVLSSFKSERESFKLGTVVKLAIYGRDKERVEKTVDILMSEITRYENLFSVNIPTSEISKINSAPNKDIKISDDLAQIINDSLKFAKDTEGAFDFTIGPIVKLWGIGTDSARLPKEAEIDKALSYVGYEKISITEDILHKGEGQKLDLGGIAKGWIADRLIEKLKQEGIDSALIDLGGNIAVKGRSPKGRAWKLGLQHPYKVRGEYFAIVDVADTSVVTSGPYERFFENKGVRYHHIFDSKTGYPSDSDLASVTIVSENSGQADALCTAFFVMGHKKSMEFLANHKGIQAVLVIKDSKKVLVTAGLQKSFTLKDSEMSLEIIGN